MAGNSCFSTLAAMFVVLLLLSTTATAKKKHGRKVIKAPGIEGSPFCTTATTNPDDKAICTALVAGAKTWPEAMTNALNAVIGEANKAKPMVDGLGVKLPPGLRPITVESISGGCKEAHDTYVFNLEQCLGFVKNDPTSALDVYLSGSTFMDCKESFDEFEIPNPEVNKFYDDTVKFANILLSIYQTKPQK